jgi:hypothetical protein
LFEDSAGQTPEGPEAEAYHESIGEPPYPVTADPELAAQAATPFTGRPIPGKCLLSPEMEILGCEDGHGADTWARPLIEEHEDR